MSFSSPTESHAASRLPQFTLRTMFLAISCCAVLFAICAAIGLMATCGFLLVLTLVSLHIIGNALGTALRDEAPSSATSKEHGGSDAPNLGFPALPMTIPADTRQSVSRLSQRTPLGWIIFPIMVLGAVIGGWVGRWALINYSTITSLRSILVGTVSSAVLGGIAGFMLGSLFKIWFSAWSQAVSEADHFEKRPPATVYMPKLSANTSAALIADLDAG
jgi:integral membrane sensor domain MASE1